ncbi:hypothetical protein IWW50_002195 [Coemansia erecta]|nr:hypothetical protein GGF43_001684 [Coemansia sp. RSA 2618]KAJ2826796.1 hypothetical protein IWW50_002195 [Coemansia erecta]
MDDASGAGRDEIIRLMLCQLSAYGFANLSQAIAAHTKVPMTTDSNSRLAELVQLGLQSEQQQVLGQGKDQSQSRQESQDADADADIDAGGFDPGRPSRVAAAPQYQMWYKTKHKGAATTAAFSRDGQYIATGSADMSLKLIEVDRVRRPSAGSARREDKPVIRTLYNHEAEVTGVAFHPNGLVLASCAADHSIKLFDISAAYGKHAFHSFGDNHAFRSIAFHPSGDFLAAAGDSPDVRLYNVRTGKAYLLGGGESGPRTAVAQVAYSSSGALIASASSDGAVRLWDGVAGTCVRSIQAHDGRAATGVVFSRSGKHVLTTGLDSSVRLWDVGSGRLVQTYAGARLDAPNAQAVFSHDETLVMAADAQSNAVVCWDAQSAALLARTAEHSQRITWIAASPTTPAFMTCSADECVRFWSPDTA